jgi:hypothetical protein
MTKYLNILTTHDRSRIAEENDILLIVGYWIIVNANILENKKRTQVLYSHVRNACMIALFHQHGTFGAILLVQSRHYLDNKIYLN